MACVRCPLRLKRHEASALEIAEWLEGHPMVKAVNHPGLPSFEGHQLHRSQSSGDSGLFSFALKQRSEAARRLRQQPGVLQPATVGAATKACSPLAFQLLRQ
ncbi:MAG: PLP-dependent transferase [Caldilineaceae bacterium]